MQYKAFIGLDCEQTIRPFLKEHDVFYHPKPLHVTMFYLGYITKKEQEKVIQTLSRVKFPGTTIKTTHLNTFDKPDEIKMVYLGIEENKVVHQLHHTIENKLKQEHTYPSFNPHITIGRFKEPIQIENLPQPPEFSIPAKKFYLYVKDDKGTFQIVKGF